MATSHIFRIMFVNQGKVYEIYARRVSHGELFGFIEVEELVFGERATVVVDPAEERIKGEFDGVKRTYLPLHSILRIDEVAHQYAGHEGSGASDAGVTSRRIGRHLTWLEERKPGIFVMANTNQPWDLPAHMSRPGRFNSGIWYVPIPSLEAVEEILKIHIGKYFPRLADTDTGRVVDLMREKHMTGDEIEQSLLEAGRMTHPDNPTIDALMAAAEALTPMYKVRNEDFTRLQDWALVQKRAKEA